MNKKKNFYFFVLLIILIFYLSFHYLNINNAFEQRLQQIFSPIQRVFYNIGLTFKKFGQLNEIFAENEYLKKELAKFSVDYAELAKLKTENQYLKDELHFLSASGYGYQLTDVIGKQLYNDQVLFINRGSKDGLREGLSATAAQGVIVGKVVAVEDYRSQVQLLTDTNSKLAVTLVGLTGTVGVVKGKIGNSLNMDYIPQNIELKPEDIVVTSGLDNNIPEGLLVGKISSVAKVVGQIFQKANILPYFNYQNLRTLTIIIPQN